MMHTPLKGIKVVELTIWAAGPMCGKILGQWGADVIKVETLGGDPSRTQGAANYGLKTGDPYENPSFEKHNLNTRSITLDLKSEAGKEAMYDLLATADVFVTNMRLKAVEKLGCGYETLAAKFPKLVWAHLDGYGPAGPMKDAPGFDLIAYFAHSGMMIEYCEQGEYPLTPAIAFGDFSTGATLAGGIAAALFQRTQTGKGDKIMISLLGQAVFNQTNTLVSVNMGTDYYPKSRLTPGSPLINTYKCKDGEWVMVSMLEYARFFPVMCKLMERPDLLEDDRFNTLAAGKANTKELTAILDAWFSTLTRDEISEMLGSNDVPFDKVLRLTDIPTDPQVLANDYVYWEKSRNGAPLLCTAPPLRFGNMELPEYKPAPLLGEHSAEVLREIGYSEEKIQSMLDNKVTSVTVDELK